jgi:hypothetical protein
MKTNIQMEIPVPCHEDWNHMIPTAEGRFCNHCEKVVVDFSTMSDKEVLNYFQHHSGRICGRVSSAQLKKPDIKPLNRRLRFFLYVFALSFLLHSTEPLFAQDSTTDSTLTTHSVSSIVKGKVIDDKNQPLDFATVQLLKNDVVVGRSCSDLNGRFIIALPEQGIYVLRVTYAGFTESKTEITIIEGEHQVNVKLIPRTVSGYAVGGIMGRSLLSKNPGVQRVNREQIKNFGL